jgi:hypothetical protein
MKYSRLIKLVLVASFVGFFSEAFSALQNNSNQSTSPWSLYALRENTYFHLGGFWSYGGETQHINIQTLIGDTFIPSKKTDGNVVLGLSHFVAEDVSGPRTLSPGISVFYLANSGVKGSVLQENLFTNLNYQYDVSNIPFLMTVKVAQKLSSRAASLTLDAGLGPNIMLVGSIKETPLDALPDNPFGRRVNLTLGATVGVGVQFDNVFKKFPLECGYRFFYLGEGKFKRNNTQIVNELRTGQVYANAIMCAVRV